MSSAETGERRAAGTRWRHLLVRRLAMIGTEFKAVITQTTMSEEMQKAAAEVSADACVYHNTLEGISKFIKLAFENQYGNNWQCVVGKEFASYISYEGDDFIVFRLDRLTILLYRCG